MAADPVMTSLADLYTSVYGVYTFIAPYLAKPVNCLLRPFVGTAEPSVRHDAEADGGAAYSADDEASFAAAAAQVASHGGQLPTAVRLRLYALYKQATVGDATAAPSASVLDAAAQVKWRGWAALRGMGRGEAMRLYTAMATHEAAGGGGAAAAATAAADDDDVPEELLDMESELSKGLAGPVMSTMAADDDDDEESPENYAGRLPLHSAARRGHPALCRDLIEAGARVDATDEDGHTALHLACDAGECEVVACLLQQGASPDVQNADGSTPLHMACACGHLHIAEVLLRSGASTLIKDMDGCLATELASAEMLDALQPALNGRRGSSSSQSN
ncbi:hypothetical protein AB1Y20_011069 [Prymnesium parvum]|uniref:ACB domain-containing protein n=1 Tax=Prymnesium parvum TaxID=97485 RepID=A0AB34IM68_PRYPA